MSEFDQPAVTGIDTSGDDGPTVDVSVEGSPAAVGDTFDELESAGDGEGDAEKLPTGTNDNPDSPSEITTAAFADREDGGEGESDGGRGDAGGDASGSEGQ